VARSGPQCGGITPFRVEGAASFRPTPWLRHIGGRFIDGLSGRADVNEQLAPAAWLRRLAAYLVRGQDEAEELAHETWVAAAQHPPDPCCLQCLQEIHSPLT